MLMKKTTEDYDDQANENNDEKQLATLHKFQERSNRLPDTKSKEEFCW